MVYFLQVSLCLYEGQVRKLLDKTWQKLIQNKDKFDKSDC